MVLIVDDHVDSREVLAAMLHEAGVTTAEAGTGRDALRRLRVRPLPGLVIIDMSLPDCHGTAVVRAIKLDPDTRDIPVVALSASVMPADKAAAAGAGCAAFLDKPVLPEDVISLVRRLLDGAVT